MIHTEYVIEKNGAKSVRISLPCFSGEDDFAVCAVMNRFYSSAADQIYLYAASLLESAERRARFTCLYDTADDEKGFTVTLRMSYMRQGSRAERKTLSHTWRNGHIISKSLG